MAPALDAKQVSFSAASIRLIEVGLEFRGLDQRGAPQKRGRESTRARARAYPPTSPSPAASWRRRAKTPAIAAGAFEPDRGAGEPARPPPCASEAQARGW